MATLVLSPEPQVRPATRRRRLSADAELAVVVGAATAVRLAWVAVLPLSMDEGYHYLYTAHPSPGYFDHPPLMMPVTALGLALCGGAVNYLSLRLGFVLMAAVMTWVLGRWTARQFGARAGVFAAVWWNLAPFFGLSAGAQVGPDGPFLFFALLTVVALHRAVVEHAGRTRPWVGVGVAWGFALLGKYVAVLLPAGALLYLLLTPPARRLLLTPGPYLAVAVGLAMFSPVVYWNATHGWASFAFQGERAVGTQFTPHEIGMMLAGQMALLTPALWVALLVVLFASLRRWRTLTPTERLLVCLAVVPLGFFLAVSCVRGVGAHWPLVGFLPLLPLLGRRCVDWYHRWPQLAGWGTAAWAGFLVAAAFLVAAYARGGLFDPQLPPSYDPAWKMTGWDEIAARLDAHGLADRPNTFVFGEQYHEAGQLGFAVAGRSPVLCLCHYDTRGFAYWSRPDDWLGWDGVMVALDDKSWEPKDYAPFFTRIELVDEFWTTRHGRPLRHVRLYLCSNQTRPYPFTCPALPPTK